MTNKESHNGFVTGAALGGLIGSVAGLLLAPKSGKDLRCDIAETYCDVTEGAEKYGKKIKEKGEHLLHFNSEKEDSATTNFLIGSVIGAVVGATAAVVLAPKSGSELRKNITKTYDDVKENADEWKENIVELAQKFGKTVNNKTHSKIDDIVDFASVGIKIWNNLKKGK